MTFSEKLIRLRKREGISQEELASYLEVSRQAVSRWEQGTALPDAGNLLKLRQRFGVSVDWLLTEEQGWEALEGKPAAQTACESARTASQPEKRKNILPWAVPLGISAFGLLLLGIFASLFPAIPDSGRFSGGRDLAGGCVESDRNRAGTCGRRKERITGFRSACCGRIRG